MKIIAIKFTSLCSLPSLVISPFFSDNLQMPFQFDCMLYGQLFEFAG